MKYLYNFICFYSIFYNNFLTVYCYYCHLPEKCRIEMIPVIVTYTYNENLFNTVPTIMCDIDDDSYELKINSAKPLVEGEKGDNFTSFYFKYVNFRWTNTKKTRILDKRLNFANVYSYFADCIKTYFVRFWGLNGFDINMLEGNDLKNRTLPIYIKLYDCRIEFYHNAKRMNSCEDVKNANLTRIGSIFQMGEGNICVLDNVEYKGKICPLLFSNMFANSFLIINIADTFYKKNVIAFSNDTFDDLNSRIFEVSLTNVQSINLDASLLHPSVFKNVTTIYIQSGSMNSISGEIFRHFNQLQMLNIWSAILRKINHKQGIGWIRNINRALNVNLSNLIGVDQYPFTIIIGNPPTEQRKRFSKIFPDEDFCIYLNFPFDQFVIITEAVQSQYILNIDTEFTCTFLWLIQYYENYHKYYMKFGRDFYGINLYYLEVFLNSTSFKRISQCDFEERKTLCNKSNYQISDIWDENDFFILNKKIKSLSRVHSIQYDFLD